jgi:hypothetical protein
LPQVIQIGKDGSEAVDFLEISRRMIGTSGEPLFTEGDMQAIRDRMEEIQARIRERSQEIESLKTERSAQPDDEPPELLATEEATADRVEEIRQSVTDAAVKERVERLGQQDEAAERRNGSPDNGEGSVR